MRELFGAIFLHSAIPSQSPSKSEQVRPLKIMSLNRNGKIARIPDHLGEDGGPNHHRRCGVPGRTELDLLIRRMVFSRQGKNLDAIPGV